MFEEGGLKEIKEIDSIPVQVTEPIGFSFEEWNEEVKKVYKYGFGGAVSGKQGGSLLAKNVLVKAFVKE